jgi:DNA-binding transcriptional regulator YdaS (Cro superfamily)
MTLNELFTSGRITMADMVAALGMTSDAQIRQWRHGYRGRRPDTTYCVRIEQFTKGLVMRWDLYPSDWWLHWPELRARPDAPPIPSSSAGPSSTQAQNARNPQEIAA